MKKLLCVALVVVMVLSLAACGSKLSGTYETEKVLNSYIKYEFSGSKVTVTTYAVGIQVLQFEGTYKISGDEITFTYAEDQDTGDALTGTQTFEKGDGYIKIGGVKLTKQ